MADRALSNSARLKAVGAALVAALTLITYPLWKKAFVGFVFGIVAGISEWLPVSSKTQLMIASTILLKFNFQQAYAIGLFLEGGTFIAALIYFRREVWEVLKALVGRGTQAGKKMLVYLVITTVITGIIGVIIYKSVEASVTGPVIGIPMIALGILLIVDGIVIKMSRSRLAPRKGMRQVTLLDMAIIGIAQGLSALPGISRSGMTVSAMLFLGVNPEDAFRLSFIALLPASIGASAVTILFSHAQLAAALSAVTPTGIVIAIAATVVVSLIFIDLLLKMAKSNRITTLVFALGVIAIFSGLLAYATGFG